VTVFIFYQIICPRLNCYAESRVVCFVGKLLGRQFVFTEQFDNIHNCRSILED